MELIPIVTRMQAIEAGLRETIGPSEKMCDLEYISALPQASPPLRNGL